MLKFRQHCRREVEHKMATDFSRGELGKKVGVARKPVYAFKLLRTVKKKMPVITINFI